MTVVEIKYNDDRLTYVSYLDFKRIFYEVTGSEMVSDETVVTGEFTVSVMEKFVQDGHVGRQRVKYSVDDELRGVCQLMV
jgi:hypothetical protein